MFVPCRDAMLATTAANFQDLAGVLKVVSEVSFLVFITGPGRVRALRASAQRAHVRMVGMVVELPVAAAAATD